MFGPADQTDASREARSMSRAEAQERANLEPLIEIMQHKGDSECLLDGDTRDEACAFEKVPYDSFEGASLGPQSWSRLVPTRAGTVREALKSGLIEEARLGVNPFAYGILASTDTHTAMPGSVDERGYTGHTSTNKGEMKGSLPDVVQYNPGGLAGVFAEENTRESLFAALRRKEVFGTSGPRIVVRLFGGPNYPDDLCRVCGWRPHGRFTRGSGARLRADLCTACERRPRQRFVAGQRARPHPDRQGLARARART
jgi:hypothetical protein